jgi:catechol 2,3-dioxygenase-like lactoylglutathione lyase family enzyme
MPPTFTQLDHCSIIITDVERSRRFYGELLGLREINSPKTFDFIVVWYDLGNQHLHLLLKDRPDTISPRHFALRVADVAAARTYFKEQGVSVDETTLIPGADRFFIRDPDGNRIEIIQWLRPYDPATDGIRR